MGARLYPERSTSASKPRGSTVSRRRATLATVGALILLLAGSPLALAAGPSIDARWHVASAGAAGPTTTDLTLTVTVEKGWHVNANDPDRPYLIPTTLDVAAPDGVTIQSIRYPDPAVHALAFASGSSLRLYEGTFAIGVRVAGPVPARFDATLGYQACNEETCLPPKTLAVPFEAKAAGGAK